MKNFILLIVIVLLHLILAEAQTTVPEVANPSTDSAAESDASPQPSSVESEAAGASASGALPFKKRDPVRVARFAEPPVIDGQLGDAVWKRAAVLKDFYQISPGDNIAPSRDTRVYLGYDAKNLYIAFEAFDEPEEVRATLARRDAIFDDDNVRIYLDTFGDQRQAYLLIFNPYGVQADGIYMDGRGEDLSVDIVMDSKGTITEDGYIVEVAVPFKSLRYEAGKGKSWGVHASRRIKRFNNEADAWMPISRNIAGILTQAGRIYGLEGISTERTYEIIPTLTLSQTGKRVRALPPSVSPNDPVALADPGRFVNPPIAFDPGLTAKFSITPTITLDFALNPDFAQVEADQTVITANQRFPIFFPEKRPFFLEGIEVFRTPIQAVNTRAIVDPDYAVKLTGKRGRNTFGLLVASDNAPGNYGEEDRANPDLQKFIDKNALIGVLRLKRDIGNTDSNIGLVATTYNFIERRNQLGGIDGRFRLNPQTIASFQLLATTSRQLFFDPNQDENTYRRGDGFAYSWSYDKTGRNLGYMFSGEGRTRDYRAGVGFTRRTNTNRESLFVRYSTDPKPRAKIISTRVTSGIRSSFDWQRRIQNWESESRINFTLQRQTFFALGYEGGYDRLFEEEFGPKRTATQKGAFFGPDSERSTYRQTFYIDGETAPTKKYSASIFAAYSRGDFDFDFGAGRRFPRVSPAALLDTDAPLDPGPGDSVNINIDFDYQPTDALRASFEYTKSRLARNDTRRVAFDDNVFSLRTTYQFTRFTFARVRLDYTTLSSRVRGQFLLGWTPNPGTSFYVGYNDDLARNGYSPFTDQLEPGFRRNGRTFFIKMSYLIRRSL